MVASVPTINLLVLISAVYGLNQIELNELSRKFKYYHSAVRPAAPDNFISNRNGTYFRIPVDVHLISTRVTNRALYTEIVFVMSWIDERLRLRELTERFTIPVEFQAWHPTLLFLPPVTSKYITLSPSTGHVSTYSTIKKIIECTTDAWKYPFEMLTCHVTISSDGDELVSVSKFVDLRSNSQKFSVSVKRRNDNDCHLELSFRAEWPRAILSAYLPAVLVMAAVFFAQWKRRKVQILVSLSAMICILIMLCSQRPYTATTLMDLWLCANFIHAVFLVLIDLTLPARRIRYSILSARAKPAKIISKVESERNCPLKYVNHIVNYVKKSEYSPKTTIVGETSNQRQVNTAILGNRKRIALCFIAVSYLSFLLVYAIIVLAIN